MTIDRRTFLAMLGAGSAVAAFPSGLGPTMADATVRRQRPVRAGGGTNRYLEGLYAPVTEEVTAFDLPITGVLPPELDGRYLRNGPNPAGTVDEAKHHWFVGDGMVHGVRLREGKAEWYRNRWVRSRSAAAALGEEPAPGEHPQMGSWANTNVISHAGQTLAIIEGGGRPAVLTDDLETVRFTDFDGGLPGGFTAHPKRHPGTGELHAAGYWWQRPGIVDYVVVGLDGSVVHHAAIPTPGNPMVHDCSITDTAMVIYDLPCTFDLQAGLEGWPFPYRWNPDHAARLGVLPLRGSADQVQWFQIDPCYVFHPINAYDVGTRVVIDVIRHPKVFATDLWGPNEGAPATWRYVLDRATGTATEQQLDDRPLEFPRIDERVVGRQHRYSWAVEISLAPDGDVLWPGTGLVRRDRASQTSTLRTFGPGRTVGEAVFVPRSPDAGADDGWYLAFVHDAATDRSELVVLDGQGWSDEPVAVVHLPARVPLGFHGSWVPSVAEEPPPPTTSTPTIPPTTTPTQPPAAAPAQPLSGNPTFTG